MLRRLAADPQSWYFAIGVTWSGIMFAGGHAGLPLVFLVPYVWVNIGGFEAASPEIAAWQSNLTLIAGFAAIAVVAWFISLVFDSSDTRSRVLQAVAILNLAVSAFIAMAISEAPVLTVITAVPFGGAIVGFVRAWRSVPEPSVHAE